MGGQTLERVAHTVESLPVKSTVKKLSRSHTAHGII